MLPYVNNILCNVTSYAFIIHLELLHNKYCTELINWCMFLWYKHIILIFIHKYYQYPLLLFLMLPLDDKVKHRKIETWVTKLASIPNNVIHFWTKTSDKRNKQNSENTKSINKIQASAEWAHKTSKHESKILKLGMHEMHIPYLGSQYRCCISYTI